MAAYLINDDGDDGDIYPTVPRVTPTCPKCDSPRSRSLGASRGRRTRYHRCLQCGLKYRSIEVPPPPLSLERN